MKYTDGFRFCEKMQVYAAIGFFILGYQWDSNYFTSISAGLFLGTSFGNGLAWRSCLKFKE
jgi:hypothetical protein